MKRVTEIKEKRTGQFVMERLRKGHKVELDMEIKDVQRNMSLIRSPAAGLKERRAKEAEQEAAMMDQDDEDDNINEENIKYVDAKLLEKQLLLENNTSDSDEDMRIAETV